jgi:hypothetical protein
MANASYLPNPGTGDYGNTIDLARQARDRRKEPLLRRKRRRIPIINRMQGDRRGGDSVERASGSRDHAGDCVPSCGRRGGEAVVPAREGYRGGDGGGAGEVGGAAMCALGSWAGRFDAGGWELRGDEL